MSGHRDMGHLRIKPAREIFLTSTSLSFSSLSSCSSSWNDAFELSTKDSKTSGDYKSLQKGEVTNSPTQGSEISSLTPRLRMQPASSPPSRLPPPVPMMNKGLGCYDPDRIPASVFNKTGEGNWSEMSNDSLFSLTVDGQRMSSAFRISNIRPEEVIMPGEYLSYSPSLLGMLEDVEEDKRSEVNEIKSAVRSAEANRRQEKSTSTSVVSCSSSTDPNNPFSVDQAWPTQVQPVSLPVREKKGKKTKKTRKSKKKKNKKKKNNKCCIWSWLYSNFSKCRYNLCCYEWRKYCCCCCCCCCCRPKATGS